MSQRESDLRSQLSVYQAADEREHAHLVRMRELCDAGLDSSLAGGRPARLDSFARDTFQPGHFTASAFILSPTRGELLLILHGKLGLWLQPGGHVEPDDRDLLSAARREAAEEVGLHDLELEQPGPFDVDIHDIPGRHSEPSHAHFDVRYLFRASHYHVTAASDAQAVRWLPLDEVDAELTDQSVLRAVRKLRARQLGPASQHGV